jgi:hypothetical protein
LEVLDDPDCTAKQAAAAWDAVFNTKFFSDRLAETVRKTESNSAILANLVSTRDQPRQYHKEGGGRFA